MTTVPVSTLYADLKPPLHEAYLAALVAGNPRQARAVVEALLGRGVGVGTVYVDVLAPAMRQIGELWQAGRVSVAQEHLASAITQTQLAWLAPLLPTRPQTTRQIVLSGTPGELHVVGLQMLADILAADGWQVLDLGAALPGPDLVAMVGKRQPEVVGLSTALTSHLREVRDIVTDLHALSVPPLVLVGGAAYGGDPRLARQVGADLFASNAVAAADALRLVPGRAVQTVMAENEAAPPGPVVGTDPLAQLATAADAVGVARLDDAGRILTANDAFARLAGRPVVGTRLDHLVAATQGDLVRTMVETAGESWAEVFLGFASDEVSVPVDRIARVGRVGGEVVLVLEATPAEAGRVNESLLALVRELAAIQRILESKTHELQVALDEVQSARLLLRKVEGILPICMGCGRVRSDDDKEWLDMSEYLARSGSIALSHGYCPRCAELLTE